MSRTAQLSRSKTYKPLYDGTVSKLQSPPSIDIMLYCEGYCNLAVPHFLSLYKNHVPPNENFGKPSILTGNIAIILGMNNINLVIYIFLACILGSNKIPTFCMFSTTGNRMETNRKSSDDSHVTCFQGGG